MKAATGVATGALASPELAAAAVHDALARSGQSGAEQVVLLLTSDFSRLVQPAIVAAARAASCLQVSGCTVSGLLTERGWHEEQSAAAALVFTPLSRQAGDSPLLSFSGQSRLPFAWQRGAARAGLIDQDAVAWQHGHITGDACAEIRLPGVRARRLLSTGLHPIGKAQVISRCDGHELRRIGSLAASDSLRRALPAELREHPPLHQIALLRQPDEPGIPILALHADGSLTLAAPVEEAEQVTWAIRQPLHAEQEMRQLLASAVNAGARPDFALMFSCIGRGPLFYGNDDRDLQAFRETFPGVPLLGAYGIGQIAATPAGNSLFHNAALTLLFESCHVQSLS